MSLKTGKIGRPEKPFEQKCERSKRNSISKLATSADNVEFLLKSAKLTAKNKGDVEIANSINKVILEHKKAVKKSPKEIIKLSPLEALHMILKKRMTKDDYLDLKRITKLRNADIFPGYDAILAEKLECRPKSVIITGVSAKVSVHDLVYHTVDRIIQKEEERLSAIGKSLKDKDLNFIFSWGFDGSTSQSQYNQRCTGFPNAADSSLFVTVINPLRLHEKGDVSNIIWNNPAPLSMRYIRPLRMERVKETKEHVLQVKMEVETEISEIQPFTFQLKNGSIVTVSIEMHLTLIDGKIFSIITGTGSFQLCPICKCTPIQMNVYDNLINGTFEPHREYLKFGINTLHSWLRVFDMLLHISYRLTIEKWQARGVKKQIFLKRRDEVRQKLFDNYGFHVDQPRSGGSGTSNSGTMARKAFEDPKKLARVLGLNEEIVCNLKTILVAISLTTPIDLNKFEEKCRETYLLYITHYKWYYMPESVHKLLIHGKDIMMNSPLPNGMFGEEGPESCNKFYRSNRENFARKDSWEHNIEDVFNRQMDISDPILASLDIGLRQKCKKQKDLPIDVIKMMLDSDDDDSDECETDENGDLYDFYYFLDDIDLESESTRIIDQELGLESDSESIGTELDELELI